MTSDTQSKRSQPNGLLAYRYIEDDVSYDDWDKGYWAGVNNALEELKELRHALASAENNGYIRGFNNGIEATSRKARERSKIPEGNDLPSNEKEETK